MELNDLYKKHRVLSDGFQRRYIISTLERRYDLEHATPFELLILVPKVWEDPSLEGTIVYPNVTQKKFENRAWTQLLKEFVAYSLQHIQMLDDDLISFRTDWSKAPIFSKTKTIDNMVEIREGLFFSVNYTAMHSTWIIGDLMKLFGLNYGFLIVHRPPEAEPSDIKEEVGRVRREEFKRFLMVKYGKTEEKADKIVKNFESLNKLLVRMGTSYNDFFLFDDATALSNYKVKLLKDYYKYVSWDENQMKTVRRYLDYLTDFYTKIKKEARKHSDNLDFLIPIL